MDENVSPGLMVYVEEPDWATDNITISPPDVSIFRDKIGVPLARDFDLDLKGRENNPLILKRVRFMEDIIYNRQKIII